MRRAIALAILAVGLAAALVLSLQRGHLPASTPAASAASRPATRPADTRAAATRPAATAPLVSSYIDWLHLQPGFAGAEREKRLLPLFDAAHLRCPDGAVVDSRGGVWVIHPDGPPFAAAASAKGDEADHVTRDPLLAVFWSNVAGRSQAYGIVQDAGGAYLLLGADGTRRTLRRGDYDWARLRIFDGECIVPCKQAVSAIRPGENRLEEIFEFPAAGDEPVQLVEAGDAMLAFVPQHSASAEPAPVIGYAGERWASVGAPAWRGPVLHLRPLADSNFVQLIRPGETAGTVQLEILARTASRVERQRVEALIRQLGSDQPLQRDKAERLLDTPDCWSVIEELLPQQPPEPRLRMQEILARRNTCSLGRWEIRDQRLELVQRFSRGAIFRAPAGLVVAGEAAALSEIAVLDGEVIVLSAPASAALRTGLFRADDDWILQQEGRFVLGALQQRLTRKVEGAYSQFIAVSGSGYLFGKPGSRECLLIDRRTADPSPRLPGWEISVEGETGWDSGNWPAIKKGGAWALREKGWKPLKAGQEQFLTALPAGAPAQANAAAASPAGAVQLSPTTRASGGQQEITLLIDGQPAVHIALTPPAQGSLPEPRFAMASADAMYVYNEPGRVVQLGRAGAGAGWQVQAVHERNLPRVEDPRRFWLDPAGRLCLAWDNRLLILFPQGRIPLEILDLMPREQILQLERDE